MIAVNEQTASKAITNHNHSECNHTIPMNYMNGQWKIDSIRLLRILTASNSAPTTPIGKYARADGAGSIQHETSTSIISFPEQLRITDGTVSIG